MTTHKELFGEVDRIVPRNVPERDQLVRRIYSNINSATYSSKHCTVQCSFSRNFDGTPSGRGWNVTVTGWNTKRDCYNRMRYLLSVSKNEKISVRGSRQKRYVYKVEGDTTSFIEYWTTSQFNKNEVLVGLTYRHDLEAMPAMQNGIKLLKDKRYDLLMVAEYIETVYKNIKDRAELPKMSEIAGFMIISENSKKMYTEVWYTTDKPYLNNAVFYRVL